MTKPERILVIRLGALGDLVLCFQAFHEIRAAHPGAEIALLTMPAFADFARAMPWFDKVIIDDRAPLSYFWRWARLVKEIRAFNPTRVYDLQGKLRQSILYALLGGPFGPEWSGAAPFCSHPRLWPPQPDMHYTDFVNAQLRRAKVPPQAAVDLNWLDDQLDSFALPERYAVLIPGCATGREYKRWPAASYAALAKELRLKGVASFAIGTKADSASIAAIQALEPELRDLSGQTSLPQLAALVRKSQYVIGNDTGPTHLSAAVGAKTLTLFSALVNPVWSAPRGPATAFLQGQPLEALDSAKVLLALASLVDRNA